MPDEKPQGQPDAYIQHLAEVNDSKTVIASEDIVNSQGALVLKKGTEISQSVTDKILKHKLEAPLENNISIEDELQGEDIVDNILSLVNKHSDLLALHQQTKPEPLLKALAHKIDSYSLVKQKLTVLALQLPNEYEKGCFCAWLGTIIAARLGLDKNDLTAVFMAGLLHDIGLLHIDPNIVLKKGEYTPDEWRAMHSHVVIGHIIVKTLPGLPKSTATAILEHHENCKGTGYPKGKFDHNLSTEGQIIGFCDEIHPIRMKKLEADGKNIKNLLPILQLNDSLHFYAVYSTFTAEIGRLNISAKIQLKTSEIKKHCTELLVEFALLKGWSIVLHTLLEQLPNEESPKALHVVRSEIERLKNVFRYSGMLSEGLERWLLHMMKSSNDLEKDGILELEELKVMFDELIWQHKKLRRLIYGLFEERALSTLAAKPSTKTNLAHLDSLNNREIPEKIEVGTFKIDSILGI